MRNLLLILISVSFGLIGFVTPTNAEEPLKVDTKTLQKTEEKRSDKPQVVKKVRYKKTQEVSFDSESVDGVVRNPYGAYLTQKKGMEFEPLYKVRDRFDENIKDSVHYMKVAK